MTQNPRRSSPAPAAHPWVDVLPGWETRGASSGALIVGVIPGEGVGPEVVRAALGVLRAVGVVTGLRFEVRTLEAAVRVPGIVGLPAEVDRFCEEVFHQGGAMLCGPVGGRFVYDLRERFDLYCKLVPIRPSTALRDAMIVGGDRAADVDVLIVRENLAGLYGGGFGRRDGGRVAFQECAYDAGQVGRIVEVAAALARRRRGRLAVVVKRGGVPEVSALWIEQAESIARGRAVALDVLDVDNAGFQLVADPRRFDVMVAPNMLGDVIADVGAVLLGSRGMSYSVNFGPPRRAVYQTGHGAAYDLAGTDRANPVAQILTLAAMLRESARLPAAHDLVERAVERVLASGMRTPDVAGPGSRVVGTRALGERIADVIAERAASGADRS